MQEWRLAIVNPVAMIEVAGVTPAKRLTDLNNKRIGLFWNRKARGDVALRKIGEVLKKRFQGIEITWFEMQTSVTIEPHQIEALRKTGNDAIISATGD